jgi:hypothetical protein
MGKIRDCFELHKIKLHEQISEVLLKLMQMTGSRSVGARVVFSGWST